MLTSNDACCTREAVTSAQTAHPGTTHHLEFLYSYSNQCSVDHRRPSCTIWVMEDAWIQRRCSKRELADTPECLDSARPLEMILRDEIIFKTTLRYLLVHTASHFPPTCSFNVFTALYVNVTTPTEALCIPYLLPARSFQFHSFFLFLSSGTRSHRIASFIHKAAPVSQTATHE